MIKLVGAVNQYPLIMPGYVLLNAGRGIIVWPCALKPAAESKTTTRQKDLNNTCFIKSG
jgi:hypothetical protein